MTSPSSPVPVIVGDLESFPRVSLHSLPCHISTEEGKREANVKDQFETTIIKKQEGVGCGMSASFRGRPLQGVNHNLPEGYVGVVLSANGTDVPGDRGMKVKSCFTSVNEWTLDSAPLPDEGISSAFKWIRIANAIHSDASEPLVSDTPPSQ